MREETRRCISCVLPDAPQFALDEKGTCRLCRIAGAAPPAAAGGESRSELEQRIAQLKREGRGRAYDCVVGLSGGRDSTYLLYRLVRKHGLRCLAAYYRTPFTPEATDQNVRRSVTVLGVTLQEIGLSSESHRRFARELVLLWRNKPSPILANMMCAPCKLVNREIFRIARQHRVRTVVCGANPHEAVQIAAGVDKDAAIATHRNLAFGKQLARTLALVKNGIVTLTRNHELLPYLPLGVQASLMYINPHTPYLRLMYPDVRPMEYFYYHEWNEQECVAALAEVGWTLPPGCNSTWKADCAFAEVKNRVFQQMTGVSYMDGLLSNMVRSGALPREAALERLSTEGRPSPSRLAQACRTLDLPVSTFEANAA